MLKFTVKRIAITALFTGLSLVFMLFKFPLFIPFLEYDFADVPIFVFTMLYGPIYGLLVTAIVSFIQGITVSSFTFPLGMVMHFIATGSFVLVFGLIFRKFQNLKGAVIGAIFGVIVWTSIMIPLNIWITPTFLIKTGMTPSESLEYVYKKLFIAFIPFNLIKASGNSAIAISLYFLLKRTMKKDFNKLLKF